MSEGAENDMRSLRGLWEVAKSGEPEPQAQCRYREQESNFGAANYLGPLMLMTCAAFRARSLGLNEAQTAAGAHHGCVVMKGMSAAGSAVARCNSVRQVFDTKPSMGICSWGRIS